MSNLYHVLGETAGYNPYFLRHQIANYMMTDPLINGQSLSKLIKIDTGLELDIYVTNLRKKNQHFGSYEIKAYCDLFKRNVKVVYPNKNYIIFRSKDQTDIIDNIYYDRDNYSRLPHS